MDYNAKVADLTENNIWCWPNEWYDRFPELKEVKVPMVNDDVNDRVVWVSSAGKKSQHSLLNKHGRI